MNGHMTHSISVGIAIVLLSYTTSPNAAPTKDSGNNMEQAQFQGQSEEQQLESLKFFPANVAVSKTQTKSFSNINGKMEMHHTKEDKVQDADTGNTVAKISTDEMKTSDSENGKPKTVTKTEIEIPSKGIHKVMVNKKAKVSTDRGSREASESREVTEDYYLPYDSVQYTPGDMAEYIRRTGDDEGVAMAVEELMREGLMSRNEAAAYLEEVKNELEYMQDQYTNEQRRNKEPMHRNSLYLQLPVQQGSSRIMEDRRPSSGPTVSQLPAQKTATQRVLSPTSFPGIKPTPTSNAVKKNQLNSIGKSHPKIGSLHHGKSSEEEDDPRTQNRDSKDVNYGDLLERLRIADFLYKEYSLEEVIYQLSKEMFTQSIIKGNRDAEESLQRFSNFLQEETVEGRISKELETRILDVVMAALMDSVGGRSSGLDQQQMQDPQQGPSNDDRFGRSSENPLYERGRKPEVKNRPEKQEKTNVKTTQNKEQITYGKSE